MNQLDLNEIRGNIERRRRKDPLMTFIGGMIIGGLVFGLIGVIIGYNLHYFL